MRLVVHTLDSLVVERRPRPKVVTTLLNDMANARTKKFDAKRLAWFVAWMRCARPLLLARALERGALDPWARAAVGHMLTLPENDDDDALLRRRLRTARRRRREASRDSRPLP